MAKESTTIEILGTIGWDSDSMFRPLVSKVRDAKGKDIDLVVNTYGGDVMEGTAIANFLKGLTDRNVNAHIPGYSMSMGTVITSSVNGKVTMARGGYFMIHNPWGLAIGDYSEIGSTAEALKKMRNEIADVYVGKTSLPKDEVLAMMDAETWMTAEEALDKGFIDEITEGAKMKAYSPPTKFLAKCTNLPEELAKKINQDNQLHNSNNSKMPENKEAPNEELSFVDHIKAFFNPKAKGTPEAKAEETEKPKAVDSAEVIALRAENAALKAEKEESNTTLAQIQQGMIALAEKFQEFEGKAADTHTTGKSDTKPEGSANEPAYKKTEINQKAAALQRKV